MKAAICLGALLSIVQPEWGAGYTRHYISTTPARYAVCSEVYDVAAAAGLDPAVAVAFATVETKHRADRIGEAGEIGPLQVLPQYHCPAGVPDGCNPLAAGVGVIQAKLDRHGSVIEAAAHYNGGNTPGTRARTIYAPRVAAIAHALVFLRALLGGPP